MPRAGFATPAELLAWLEDRNAALGAPLCWSITKYWSDTNWTELVKY